MQEKILIKNINSIAKKEKYIAVIALKRKESFRRFSFLN